MTFYFPRISSLTLVGTLLFAAPVVAQTRPAQPESPYGGSVVEDIIARVNDQIITRSDYDRALKELDTEGRQRGLSMQQLSEEHKDLLRNSHHWRRRRAQEGRPIPQVPFEETVAAVVEMLRCSAARPTDSVPEFAQ